MTQAGIAVAMIMPSIRSHEQAVSRGLMTYAERKELSWRIYPLGRETQGPAFQLTGQDVYPQFAAAVILDGGSSQWADWIQQTTVPLVHVQTGHLSEGQGSNSIVGIDNVATGRLAAQHFAEAGYQHVAAIHSFGTNPTRTVRREAFFQEARQRGLVIHEYVHPKQTDLDRDAHDQLLVEWMHDLPKPVGLFQYNDWAAAWLRSLCTTHHIAIPNEVGILGVDNMAPICEAESPSLSSVIIPLAAMGHEAGRLLHRLLGSGPDEASVTRLRPVRIAQRDSTQISHSDPLIKRTMTLLRRHVRHPLSRQELCQRLQVSHDRLDRRFRSLVHSSVKTVQVQIRMRQACDLLVTTNAPIASIAKQCGYRSASVFSNAFSKIHGCNPSAYRQLGQTN